MSPSERQQKRARVQAGAPTAKKVRGASVPDSDEQRPLWSLAIADTGGPWCPARMDAQSVTKVVLRLKSMEGLTWTEIGQSTGSHEIGTTDLVPQAQKRLREIKQDDVDRVYSLRIEGKPRLIGIRFGNVFRVLWWDPEHAICRSTKKHT